MSFLGGDIHGFVMSWMQGAQATRTRQRVAFAATIEGAEAFATSWFGSDFDAVFVPNVEGRTTDGAPLVGFDGELAEDGEVRLDDDLIIQFQNYAVAEFLSFPGPTVLVPQTSHDRDAFAAHLAAARSTGVFPAVLTDPQVVVGDRQAWVGGPVPAEPEFVFVGEDGTVSSSPWGAVYGRITDGQFAADTGVQDGPVDEAALHFLQTLEALRYAAARGLSSLSASGYGSFLDSDSSPESVRTQTTSGAVLLFDAEHHLLHISDQHRTYSLTRDLASLVELQLRFGDQALEHADESTTLRRLPEDERASALKQVRKFIGSRLSAGEAERVSA
ncbi:hypothetical protein [Curtobacterium oceanosedimentum]|uniref:Uncharacterized protein n=1 Tax=Curtobacterium oceanosedimentum TaxID=465820 RepID=A0A147DTS7_9MICO|nr:hypothetical protein [Curtobacterium oceanosedimentum]KTR53549.1 hypothetical protein NS359_02830 [Curtobacterium oceanosedimentum]